MPLISYGHVRQTGVGRQPGLLMALVLLLCSAWTVRIREPYLYVRIQHPRDLHRSSSQCF